MKGLVAVVLLAGAALCAVGFLASFEPLKGALVWRTAYGIGALACAFGALRLLLGNGDGE